MTGDSVHTAHSVVATIQPAIILLGLGIVAAMVSRALRLNPIVGYLALGFAFSAGGFSHLAANSIVEAMAEVGVMFLLFNLGLHFSLGKIREEASNIFGFGALQMAIAGGGFAALLLAFGFPLVFALIGGLALGLSSTAVVIGLIKEREQEDCPVGRAAQSILIFQDIAAIALLVAAGALASGGALGPELGLAGAKALGAFAVAVMFARYVTEPLFRLIARFGSSEVYTATALFVALAAGWATGMLGLSLTFGAFLGGMAVADSRYRIMVQAEIDAFRGLFLSFFFMSVGLALDAQAIAQNWLWVIGGAAGLIALKCLLNVVAALINRWSLPGSIQLGFLLGQGGEFALILLALPAIAGLVDPELIAILISTIAISLALTPMVSNLGRSVAGKLDHGVPDEQLAGDHARVVIVGLGPIGRALADALRFNGIGYLAIEAEHEAFEQAMADGYDVVRANTGDPRSWEPLNMAKREVMMVTVQPNFLNLSRELIPLVKARLPDITSIIALPGPQALTQFGDLGLLQFDAHREESEEQIVDLVFEALGHERSLPHDKRGQLVAAS